MANITPTKNRVLSEKNINDLMKLLHYDNHCCNSFWPEEFARAVEDKVIKKLRHEGKLVERKQK